jgi:glutamate N-acetyltransferase/amino-acid N-acetyltransferase
MANGLAGGAPIETGGPEAEAFASALAYVCTHLAKAMVADAEGATKVIETRVDGAVSLADARLAAREVVRSLGVKTAVYGRDPNWGRILSAIGNSGASARESTMAVYLGSPDGGEICLFRDGSPLPYDVAQAKACLAPRDVRIRVNLGLGQASATAWGSDLTVRLNSMYTT